MENSNGNNWKRVQCVVYFVNFNCKPRLKNKKNSQVLLMTPNFFLDTVTAKKGD